MNRTESNILLDEYRLIFLQSGSEGVLMHPDGIKLRLPRVRVARGSRVARELQQSARDTFGIDAIILDFIPALESICTFVIAEIASASPGEHLSTASIDDIPEDELEIESRELAKSLLAGVREQGKPFSRLGWMKEAIHWLSTEVDQDLIQSPGILQYNAGATFALVRFESHTGRSYWLKATGSPNQRESLLTRVLASHFEDYLPNLVAYRLDWNAWVTEDCGEPLSNAKTCAACRHTVVSLAGLQIASMPHIGELLSCCCADMRTSTLVANTPRLIAYLEEAMDRQTSKRAIPLTSMRLREIGRIIEDACAALDALEIPNTLLHNDINLTNILVSGSRCVFIDWAEAAVGSPFFTFEHLRAQILSDTVTAGWMPSLDQNYQRQWATCLTRLQVQKGMALARLLAIVAHLYGRGDWLTSGIRQSTGFEASARSLARHMDRAARSDCFREALCK
jgi:hypothetical protein